jgi:hypothetical protein
MNQGDHRLRSARPISCLLRTKKGLGREGFDTLDLKEAKALLITMSGRLTMKRARQVLLLAIITALAVSSVSALEASR